MICPVTSSRFESKVRVKAATRPHASPHSTHSPTGAIVTVINASSSTSPLVFPFQDETSISEWRWLFVLTAIIYCTFITIFSLAASGNVQAFNYKAYKGVKTLLNWSTLEYLNSLIVKHFSNFSFVESNFVTQIQIWPMPRWTRRPTSKPTSSFSFQFSQILSWWKIQRVSDAGWNYLPKELIKEHSLLLYTKNIFGKPHIDCQNN